MNHDLHYQGIHTLSTKIKSGAISPVAVVEDCLKRIEQLNPQLNAFITVMPNDARRQAKELEDEIKAGYWRGPLHGVPVAVKDFYDTAGVKTTAGNEHLADRIPKDDAVSVAKLKEAGAIIVGKTNMDDLGMATTGLTSVFGPVINPWNKDYVTGGSSAGSAAAVASGMCYATLDTDAVGSVRLPAACCGVVGFKPSYDQISLEGVLGGEEEPDEFIVVMGHGAITARSALDAAMVFDALADKSTTKGTQSPKTLRIGVGNNVKATHEVEAAVAKAVETLRQLGNSVLDAEVPQGDPAAGISNFKQDRATVGDKAFKDVDVIVLPTILKTTPSVTDALRDPHEAVSAEETAFANYYGLPAVSVPCGFDSNGLPIGLQIVAKPGDEALALNVAQQFLSHHKLKHPSI